MPRLVILDSARRDFASVLKYVVEVSGSLDTGKQFLGQLKAKVRHLASLPATLGRPRPELGEDLRGFPFKNYILFFRYRSGRFELVNVLHGSRDIDAYFADAGSCRLTAHVPHRPPLRPSPPAPPPSPAGRGTNAG